MNQSKTRELLQNEFHIDAKVLDVVAEAEKQIAGQFAALDDIMPSFDKAVAGLSKVLAITGRVLPVTNENVQLEATFENGATVLGESHIFYCKKEQDCRIRSVRLLPEHPKALDAAVKALHSADMIVLAPGSLYTSIIPNLLVDGIADAIRDSKALKLYVCNVMTQEGETEGYTVSDHIQALFSHSYPRLFPLCLTNSMPIPACIARRYAQEGAEPIYHDTEKCRALGVELIERPIASLENGLVRHNPGHLAHELMTIYEEYTSQKDPT